MNGCDVITFIMNSIALVLFGVLAVIAIFFIFNFIKRRSVSKKYAEIENDRLFMTLMSDELFEYFPKEQFDTFMLEQISQSRISYYTSSLGGDKQIIGFIYKLRSADDEDYERITNEVQTFLRRFIEECVHSIVYSKFLDSKDLEDFSESLDYFDMCNKIDDILTDETNEVMKKFFDYIEVNGNAEPNNSKSGYLWNGPSQYCAEMYFLNNMEALYDLINETIYPYIIDEIYKMYKRVIKPHDDIGERNNEVIAFSPFFERLTTINAMVDFIDRVVNKNEVPDIYKEIMQAATSSNSLVVTKDTFGNTNLTFEKKDGSKSEFVV